MIKVGNIIKIQCSCDTNWNNTIWLVLDTDTNIYPLSGRASKIHEMYDFKFSFHEMYDESCDRITIL